MVHVMHAECMLRKIAMIADLHFAGQYFSPVCVCFDCVCLCKLPGLVLPVHTNVQGVISVSLWNILAKIGCMCLCKWKDILDVWSGQTSDVAGILIEREPHYDQANSIQQPVIFCVAPPIFCVASGNRRQHHHMNISEYVLTCWSRVRAHIMHTHTHTHLHTHTHTRAVHTSSQSYTYIYTQQSGAKWQHRTSRDV